MPQSNPVGSRATLITYCKRRLGDGVVDINVTDNQVQDCVDDGFQFYRDYHTDAIQRTMLKHQFTASTLVITSASTPGDLTGTITGATSGATATIHDKTNDTTYRIKKITGTFVAAETISDTNSTNSATVTSVTLGDVDNEYIPIGSNILGVTNVFPISSTSSSNLFDLNYQLRQNDLWTLVSADLLHYEIVQEQLSTVQRMLVGTHTFEFSRHMNKLFVYMDWDKDFNIDEYMVMEVYSIIDPDTYTEVYNDVWLKKYITALIKRQWGQNLFKYEGIQLPGGLTYSGSAIYDQATTEIENLEVEMASKYEEMPQFLIG